MANDEQPQGEIIRTVHYVRETVDGCDIQFWSESSRSLMEALDQHLGQFFFDGDEGAEALYIEGIERLGRMLRNVTLDPESGDFKGSVNLAEFFRQGGPSE